MIGISEKLAIHPNKLILVSGEIKQKEDFDNKLNTLIPDIFGNSLTSYDILKKRYDTTAVDYSVMFPINGGICLSDACDLRCNYCAFSSNETDKMIASLKDTKVFVDFLIKNLVMRRLVSKTEKDEILDIYFAGGGEPTYSWSLLTQTVEYIKERAEELGFKYTLGITTNGILNKTQVDYIIENFNLIVVSFDGIPEIHDKNRKKADGGGSFSILGKTLEYLKEKNCPIVMRTTIWPEDYKYLNDMIRFVCENYPNVEDWSVEPVNARSRAIDSCSEFVRESYTDYFINAKKFIELNQYRNILLSGKFKDNVVDFLCGTSYGLNPWLLPDGRLVTCLDARDLAPVLGKINQRKLTKYVFRDTLIEKYVKYRGRCEECYAFRFCGGGCPLRYINRRC